MTSGRRNQYEPDVVSPPGATLQDVLDERGMTQSELATRMNRPKKTISEIVTGKEVISHQTAIQLELVLGIPADFWMSRETLYRAQIARAEEMARLASAAPWVSRFPLHAMERLGWISKRKEPAEKARELLGFFGIAAPDQWEAVSAAVFRRSKAFEVDGGALSAWLRRGELVARGIDCEPFDAGRFRRALVEIRRLTIDGPDVFVPTLTARCAAAGVAIAFVPELPKTRVSGATRWLSPKKALIQLSLRHKSDDHLWFTFFHEAGHILLHGKKTVFVEADFDGDEQEQEADRFAADALVPPNAIRDLRSRTALTERVIIDVAKQLGIAPGIVVGRLQHERAVPFNRFNGLKIRYELANAKP